MKTIGFSGLANIFRHTHVIFWGETHFQIALQFFDFPDAECSRCRRDEKASCHGHRRGLESDLH